MKTKRKEIDPFEYEELDFTPSFFVIGVLMAILITIPIVLAAFAIASLVVYFGASL